MDKKMNLVLVAAALSLVLNAFAVQRLANQHDRVVNLEQANRQLVSEVRTLTHEVSSLRSELTNPSQDRAWTTQGKFVPDIAGSSRSQVRLAYEWSLREVDNSARVYLNYGTAGSGEWRQAPATRNGGIFSATLTLDPSKTYEYQVVEEGKQTRSTELRVIPAGFYQEEALYVHDMTASTNRNQTLNMQATFAQRSSPFQFFRIIQVKAKLYQDGNLVNTLNLQKEVYPEKETMWRLGSNNVTLDTIVLVAEYADGTVREEEYWSVRGGQRSEKQIIFGNEPR